MSLFPHGAGAASRLRARLGSGELLQAPGCYDALSARIIEESGFEAAFLGGFSVAAARCALPDTGLVSYAEMLDQARNVSAATSLPVLADADTGYGNAMNAERAFHSYAQAGLACIMIEDQLWPKRCGHTAGKEIVERSEALQRIRACVRAREEFGLDLLIMARTDACAVEGFEEALWRCEAFADLGADLTFLEAPNDLSEMRRYCETVPGWKTANLVEDGKTPWQTPEALQELGYALVIYPVSLLLGGIQSMRNTAQALKGDAPETQRDRVTFDEARQLLGWEEYERRLSRLEE
ncbi:MAG: oxaloacetate decarboxylase [Myxococcota bacterium]